MSAQWASYSRSGKRQPGAGWQRGAGRSSRIPRLLRQYGRITGLTSQQAEDVLNFVYDAGELIPARTTEAHHFRRIVIQRNILHRRGAAWVSWAWTGGRPAGRR